MKNKRNILIGSAVVILVVGVAFSLYSYFTPHYTKFPTRAPKLSDISSASSTFSNLTASSTATSSVSVSSIYEILGNLSYGLHQPQTKLTNGYFVGKFDDCGGASCNGVTYYSHMKLENNIVEGDLNGDGVKDAAVIVSSATTKSPSIENISYTTQVVAAVVNQGGVYKNVAAIELSHSLNVPTVAIENIAIKDGLIYATVLKNPGSTNPDFPTSSEVVKLALDASSANGFKIVK